MKLSIVVAVYNTSKYLEQCLGSVLNQTMDRTDYEVIIVNDCSTDESMEKILQITEGYENVRIIDKKVNEATFWSRVDGIVAAKGDYIGFVDSDDWVDENMYEIMLRKGCEHNADIVQCGTIYEYEDDVDRPRRERKEEIRQAVDVIREYSCIPTQLALYLRVFSRKIMNEFVNDILPYFQERREDYRGIRNEDDLLYPIFMSLSDNILFIEDYLCHHRAEIPGSTMDQIRKNPKKFVDSFIYRVNAGFDVMRFTVNKPEIYKAIEHKQINVIFGLLGKLLETEFHTKEESKKLMNDAISRFAKEKKYLPLKDELRFLHLRLKSFVKYH